MNDESNGESTFEFVEKRIEDVSISSDPTKTESTSSLSSLTSSLTPMAVSTSIGNLLSNIAPPSALPSFVANPLSTTPVQKKNENEVKDQSDDQTKQQTIESQQSVSAQSEEKEPEPLSSPENQFYDTGIVSGALFSWVKDNVVNSNMLSKVAEKAKSSVHSMMTTLDPQMHSGGDCEIIVASNEEIKVSPVREAFQSIFGKATVTGVDVDTSGIPKTPIGFAAGVNAAEQRIKFVRNELSIPKEIPIVAVQSFILEVDEQKWYELAAILLEDVKNEINLQMFSQMTPVPSQFVAMAQAETPADYPLKSSGLAISIGELMADNLQVPYNEWHHALTGVSRRDRLLLAAQSLAGIYKNTTTMV